MMQRGVLIVEDEPEIRDLLAEAIELEGISVRSAANGEEALDLLADARPEVVIVDLQMPVMDGWSLLAAMARHPDHSSIPVLIITAAPNVSRSPRAPVFVKPLNLDSLLRAVRTHLGRSDPKPTVRQ